MNTKDLIKEILANDDLHDLITHLNDFQNACEDKLQTSRLLLGCSELSEVIEDSDTMECISINESYWTRQLATIARLQRIIRENV